MPFCPSCGAQLEDSARFCSNCGARASGKKQDDSEIKNRAINIALIVFVAGMLLVFTGLSGRILMTRVVSEVKKVEFVSGDGGLGELINATGQREAISLLKALVKNDSSGFVRTVNDLFGSAAKITGDSYGVSDLFNTMFVGRSAETVFQEIRNEMMNAAGPYWTLIQIMVYAQDLLILGYVLAGVGALAWYLLGGRLTGSSGAKSCIALVIVTAFGLIMLVASNVVSLFINLA